MTPRVKDNDRDGRATRERKERFIRSFGRDGDKHAVLTLFHLYGLGMLTDEQIDEATSEILADARAMTRHVVRNRNAFRAALSQASE